LDKLKEYYLHLPSFILFAAAVLLCFSQTPWTVAALLVASCLWLADKFLDDRVKPDDTLTQRMVDLERQLASVKTAVSMKSIGR